MARKPGFVSTKLRNYLLAGVLTVVPVWITWVVFRFVVEQLSAFGMPWVATLSGLIAPYSPELATALLGPWFRQAIGVILTVFALLVLGWMATRVVGGRLIAAFDGLIQRIPLVEKIYGATKALLGVLQQHPDQVQRVVLIDFPSPEMKTIGFVTRVLKDADTGEELAAVYVPTTPNPTSGYMELVPLSKVTATDWTMDQAMTFVISGGTVAPERINYSRSVGRVQPGHPPPAATRGRVKSGGD